jgi:transcriptional regulator with GAF, ATPase, and Fis domain
VKPDNVLVDADGRGVLIDLGCACPFGECGDSVSGTASFMAPEVLKGGLANGAADLYSFGVILESLLGTAASSHVTALQKRLTHPDPAKRPCEAVEVREALGFPSVALGPPQGRLDRIVGRDQPMQAFRDALDALYDGRAHPRCLWIHGPDGSGRTRLIHEMKWESQLRGDVVEGWASDPDAVTRMFARAVDRTSLRADVTGILESRRRMKEAGPLVLVMDDVHVLHGNQAALLDAWLRMAEPTDPLMLVLAGREPCLLSSPALCSVSLGPLDAQSLASWTQGLLGPTASAHLLRLSGGFPADVEALLGRILSGDLRESDLRTASVDIVPSSARRFSSLSAEAQRTLGWLALAPLETQDLCTLAECHSQLLSSLHAEGWIRTDGPFWRLQRASDGGALVSILDPQQVAAIYRKLADRVDDIPTRAHHLARAGDWDCAGQLLSEAGQAIHKDPQAWRPVADALESQPAPVSIVLLCAKIRRLCGDLRRAKTLLAKVMRARPDASTRADCRREAACCYLAAGQLDKAAATVHKGLSLAEDREKAAALLEIGCRIGIQRGHYEAVVKDASRGIEWTGSADLRARLEESLGLALSYLGQGTRAQQYLQRAALSAKNLPPRDRVRILSYQAITHYREGDLANAVEGYQGAYDLAEEHGLADHMASTAMNLGTAHQQQGNWGQALEAYERGLQIARAIGKDNTRRTLLLNLANLYVGVGLFDRAKTTIAALGRDLPGASGDLGYVQASVVALKAEVHSASRQPKEAEAAFSKAAELFRQQGAQREVCEMALQRAALAISRGQFDRAEALLQESRATDSSPADLRARWQGLRAEMALAQRHSDGALGHAQGSLEAAKASRQPPLEAEAHGLLAKVYDRQEARQLAHDHQKEARRLWERIAVGLPESLRPQFWDHPLRASLRPPVPTKESRPLRAQHDLVRILDINRRLNSSLSVDEVLACTLDAAIELSQAERGFLLVRASDKRNKLEVAIARNLDRERIGRSHLKFSRGIAEDVVRTGQPVSTTDALTDDRFRSNASVHAMRLRSVVCVPVAAPDGVLGAIYLDHRFQKERFGTDVIELLSAFADQAAIALRNARLHADLARRTLALEAEQRRVQALLQGQAQEIDRLSSEVRTRQEALEFRYDYSAIVGRSEPMRALFRLLDRVTDTTIDVLVQGESGTGKDLVARALHYNGPRRRENFLSVNCAALPENLLESELFGVVRGAYTGADRDRQGLIVAARGGTLFLDEVGEMSLAMQAKLLRVLQERRVRPVGSNQEIEVDLRLVCATNRRLPEEVAAGRFREDLYYRIAVVELTLPPLRERREDIPALCSHFLTEAAAAMNREPMPLGADALREVMRHPLPGNVRQLDNLLRRAFVMAAGPQIRAVDLDLAPPRASQPPKTSLAADRETFQQQESRSILQALQEHGWNVSAAARFLGIPRNTFYRKLRKYRIHFSS